MKRLSAIFLMTIFCVSIIFPICGFAVATPLTYTEDFSTVTDSQITSGSSITMTNGATLTFLNSNSSGATLTVADGALKATSDTDSSGWTVTYTLPQTVTGNVKVDFDFRMGVISNGTEVALSSNSHYSNNRFQIKDENGKIMSAWGFNRTVNAFINNRDNAQTCVNCSLSMDKFTTSPTATFSHSSMTTLRAILDTNAGTVEGGAVIDGTYTHLQSQFGHNAGHDVVLPQLNSDCGGVKSIVFQLFAQDDGVATSTTFMYIDNISVSNADESNEPGTPTILTYTEDFSTVTDAHITAGTYTATNEATLSFANTDTANATLAVVNGVLKATATQGSGWTVTYTLPQAVTGDVKVDLDFRMGSIINGEEVALAGGNSHYSFRRFCVYDENGNEMCNWGFNKTNLAYINGRDAQSTCVNCNAMMEKFNGNPTANFSHNSMTTLRAILDTDNDTVEGGAVINGTYSHLQSQFGHNAGHDVVLKQITANCGGVKSITFQLFAQDGSGGGETFMYIDNISVTNSDVSSDPDTPTNTDVPADPDIPDDEEEEPGNTILKENFDEASLDGKGIGGISDWINAGNSALFSNFTHSFTTKERYYSPYPVEINGTSYSGVSTEADEAVLYENDVLEGNGYLSETANWAKIENGRLKITRKQNDYDIVVNGNQQTMEWNSNQRSMKYVLDFPDISRGVGRVAFDLELDQEISGWDNGIIELFDSNNTRVMLMGVFRKGIVFHVTGATKEWTECPLGSFGNGVNHRYELIFDLTNQKANAYVDGVFWTEHDFTGLDIAYMQIRPQQTLEWTVPNEPATFYFDNFETGNVARPSFSSNLDDVSDVTKVLPDFRPTITFTTPITSSTASKLKLYKNGVLVENPGILFDAENDPTKVVFTDDLKYSTAYEIVIPEGLTDAAWVPLSKGSFAFHTVHQPMGISQDSINLPVYVQNQPYTASVVCTNTENTARQVTFIVVLYDSVGRMVSIDFDSKTLEGGAQAVPLSVTLEALDVTGLVPQCFLWENYQTMRATIPYGNGQ